MRAVYARFFFINFSLFFFSFLNFKSSVEFWIPDNSIDPSTFQSSGSPWVVMDFTEFYWVLLGFTGFYWVLLGFTGFYLVLLVFDRVSLDISTFHRVESPCHPFLGVRVIRFSLNRDFFFVGWGYRVFCFFCLNENLKQSNQTPMRAGVSSRRTGCVAFAYRPTIASRSNNTTSNNSNSNNNNNNSSNNNNSNNSLKNNHNNGGPPLGSLIFNEER